MIIPKDEQIDALLAFFERGVIALEKMAEYERLTYEMSVDAVAKNNGLVDEMAGMFSGLTKSPLFGSQDEDGIDDDSNA